MNIVEKDEMSVIGITVARDWQGLIRDMPVKWEEFKSRLTEINQRKTDIMMDISLEKLEHTYTQCICVEVEQDAEAPEGLEKMVISSASYLHHKHEGSLVSIAQTFGEMYQYGKEHELALEEMKIDIGYTIQGTETSHDLYIKINGIA
ncbi:GyrI-like domain-containing protein [Gracilibacillus saliphilus]|uniref:GyrI-like domain-containing protein n=1 Tax=Gracilibacillus saliphilus TaxID=543890 RepID=UPI0013D55AB1|nr:effector binding domain-containing protein [Gracilibacillus saliphilus]